jgi:drug/metabolite transporter (DMT)-like permease
MSPSPARDRAALILAATCWALGTVVSKVALDDVPPLTLLPLQLAASVTVLAALMRIRGIPFRTGAPPLLGRLGLLNPGLAYALSLVGLTSITVSTSVLLWALEPLLILLLAGIVLGERVTPAIVALSLVAFAGVAIVIVDPGAGPGALVGVALTAVGVGCCAVYTVVARRFLPDAPETSSVVLSQQAHALGLALVVAVLLGLAGGGIRATGLTAAGLASAIASGVLYYAAAYWFYLGALRHVPAAVAASSFFLIPVIGLAAGGLLLHERLQPHQWAGAAIVLLAVLAILRQTVARPSAAPQAAT